MSSVTQNIHDFWPHAMDVTKDRKTNSKIKSSFMHNLLHIERGVSRKLATSVNQGDTILTMMDVLKCTQITLLKSY